jgi:glycosyltransferase involved in cell wall biosynthesis
MKKVAHILSYFPGQEGLTSFCRGLGSAFEKIEELDVPIITFRGKPAKEFTGREPPLIKYPHQKKHPFDLPAEFLRALDSGALVLDGAVLHGTYSPQVFALARALHKRKVPYIFMPHDPYVRDLTRHGAFRKFAFWHLCEKWVIDHAAAIQLLSAGHEAPLRALGRKTPVYTIANGCHPEDRKFIDPKARIPGEGVDFVIQYLGRMDRNHKGLDLLIRGFAQFLSGFENDEKIFLQLSGNDWVDRPFLESLAKELGISDRMRFTGRLPEHSVTIHSRADLSVLCSRFDGFGLTIVEAMLAGRPVMVSREAGIAEHVEKAKAGFLVDPNVASIAEGFDTVWTARGELAAMGGRAQDFVCSDLTWAAVARKSRTIYKSVFGC